MQTKKRCKDVYKRSNNTNSVACAGEKWPQCSGLTRALTPSCWCSRVIVERGASKNVRVQKAVKCSALGRTQSVRPWFHSSWLSPPDMCKTGLDVSQTPLREKLMGPTLPCWTIGYRWTLGDAQLLYLVGYPCVTPNDQFQAHDHTTALFKLRVSQNKTKAYECKKEPCSEKGWLAGLRGRWERGKRGEREEERQEERVKRMY